MLPSFRCANDDRDAINFQHIQPHSQQAHIAHIAHNCTYRLTIAPTLTGYALCGSSHELVSISVGWQPSLFQAQRIGDDSVGILHCWRKVSDD